MPLARERRKLAAIVAADVVGYSRLMGRDESGTLARLRRARSEHFDPVLTKYGGRLVKLTGDGALVEFGSAVDALSAAIEFQQAMAEAKGDRPADDALVFRMGLHLGDLIVDGDDLYGDGVNIAARLEAEAPAGGILISRTVHEAVTGRLKATFDDLGSLALKNIDRPIQAFSVKWEPSDWQPPVTSEVTVASAAAPQVPLPLPDKPSIAVLPFQNMSGDPEQEYFADGISEDIITELTRFRSLFVIARNSSFSYKGKSPDVRDVGRELGVRYVLEGSVRKAGNRVRLTGQLINAQTGSHIWAERYDRQLDDVFVVQEELTRSIVRAIAPHISEAELARVRRRRPENLTSYEIGVRAHATAWDAFARSDRELCNEALQLARSALAIDPDSATALIARTLAQAQHLWRRTATDREATWKDATEAIERLLELEPSSSLAHVWKAHMLILTPEGPRFEDALAIARQGHELNPHDMATLIGTAFVENMAGNPERAIELGQEALRVSPRDPLRPHMRQQLTMACFAAKRYVEAIEYAKLALAEAPDLPPVLAYLAASYAALGRHDEAKSALKAARKAGPEYVESLLSGTHAIVKSPSGLRTCLRVAAGLEDHSAAGALR
jgi:adenylate cyclase